MSAYPPPPPYGAPFNSYPQYPPTSGGSHAVIPPFQYQQVQDPNLQRYGQTSIPQAPFANAYSFNMNAQASRPSSVSNGVANTPYANYVAPPNQVFPLPPFPPIPIPLYGNISQPNPLLPQLTSSVTSTQPATALPQKLPSPPPAPTAQPDAGLVTASNAVAAASDLEDGELSDEESSQVTKEPNESRQDFSPVPRKMDDSRQQFGKSQSNKANVGYRSPNANGSRYSSRNQTRPKHFGRSPDRSPTTRSPGPVNHTMDTRGHGYGRDVMQRHESSSGNRNFSKPPGNMHQQSIARDVEPMHTVALGLQHTNKIRGNTKTSSIDMHPGINGYPRSKTKVAREIRDRAKAALQELHPHDIGYINLVDEGLDSSLLRDLYSEMGIQIPSRVLTNQALNIGRLPNGASTKSKSIINGDVFSGPKRMSLHQASSDTSGTMSHKSSDLVAQKPNLPSSQESTVMQKYEQRSNGGVKGQDLQSSQKSDASLRNSSPEDGSHRKPTLLEEPPNEAQRNNTSSVTATAFMTPTKVSVTSTSIPAKPSSTSLPNNSAMIKPHDKALERKDYIAQMLAAKAGKLMPTSNTPSPSTTSVTNGAIITTQTAPPVDLQNANTLEERHVSVSQSVAPVIHQGFRDTSAEQNASVEAKRKAQTDLARQKMEALKNRNASRQNIPITNSVATRPHPLPSIPPPSVLDEDLTSGAQMHDPARTTSHSSYFSPTNNGQPFSIPGLFMASPRPSIAMNTEQPINSASQTAPPQDSHGTASFTSVDAVVHPQLTLAQPTAIPSNEKPSSMFPEAVLDRLASSASKVNEPRKRQKASDFIDSPPRNVKRRLGQKEDVSVIIDVSEEEVSISSEDEADAMEIEQDPSVNIDSRQPPLHDAGTGKLKAVRDLPPLTDFPTRKKMPDNSALATPPAVQTPGKAKEQEGLKTKVKEIELMKRRIVELEQRNKAKQTFSRAQSPGTPGYSRSSPRPTEPTVGVNEHSSTDVITKLPIGALQGQAQAQTHAPTPPLAESTRGVTAREETLEQREKENDLVTAASVILQAVDKLVSDEERQEQSTGQYSRELEPAQIDTNGPKIGQITTIEERQQRQVVEQQVEQRAETSVQTDRSRVTVTPVSKAEPLTAERGVKIVESVSTGLENSQSTEGMIADEEQRRRRRAEIESGLPVLDASVERTRQKLQLLRKQMEDLESEVQEGIEGRRMLLDELVGLSPAPSPSLLASSNQKQDPTDKGVEKWHITSEEKTPGK